MKISEDVAEYELCRKTFPGLAESRLDFMKDYLFWNATGKENVWFTTVYFHKNFVSVQFNQRGG